MRGGHYSTRARNRLLLRAGILIFVLWIFFSMLRVPLPAPHKDDGAPKHHDEPEGDDSVVSPPTTLKVQTQKQRSAKPLPDPEPPLTEAAPKLEEAPPRTTEGAKGNEDAARLAQTRAAIRHSWKGYHTNAFGHDEYLPLSNSNRNWGNGHGIGVTIIDSLDTLWIAGFESEAIEAAEYLEKHVSYDQDIKVSVFETTIRVLGGLISSYQLMGRPGLKRLAVELGDRLLHAFETPSGVPDNYVNLKNGQHEGAGWNGGLAILSELGSLQMEFRALSDITGDPKYDTIAQKAIKAIKPACGAFCPRNFRGNQGTGGSAGLGSFGDSFYEYMLKYWLLVGKDNAMYKDMWDRASQHIIETSQTAGGHVVPNGRDTGNTMEHLACFSGGLFALSYMDSGNHEHLKLAEGVAETCHAMYQSTSTKLSPDVAHVSDSGIRSSDSKFILRPETVETYFYLWRATKDPKYRQWGGEMLDACDRYLKVERGYVGILDVNSQSSPQNDMLETFWLAETLKYLFLLFSDDSALNLREMVFNTEAHPFRVKKA